MKIAYTNFSGTAPKIAPRLLPESFGQVATDTKLWSGELRPFYKDIVIKQVPANTQSIYHYRFMTGESTWLAWSTPVNVVKGPLFGDENNRVIISGIAGGMRVTDGTLISKTADTIDSTNSYKLAIPAPTGIKMAVSGSGTENKESRTYVVSLVRKWDDGKLDPGKTSDPATTADGKLTVDVHTNQSVVLTNITVPASAYTESGVRKAYVYRSTVGSAGQTTYGYVGEFDIKADTTVYTYTDSLPTKDVKESAVSLEWDSPLDDLRGLVSLNNGVMAAYTGSDVYFSYPYQPHAWPTTYRVSVDYPIKGIGAFGNTVVIATTAAPALVLVANPAAASLQPIHENLPCISSQSIVNTSVGVVYATPNGLVLISSTQPNMITDRYMSRDEWSLWNPASLASTYYDNTYFGVFTDPAVHNGMVYDLDDIQKGIINISNRANVVWTDIEEQSLYMVSPQEDGTHAIVMFDTPTRDKEKGEKYRIFRWKSKIDISPQGIATFSAARVRATYGFNYSSPYDVYVKGINTFNSVPVHKYYFNGPVNMKTILMPLLTHNNVLFSYYVDGVKKYTYTVTNDLPFRLPSGFRGSEIEVEVQANIPIHGIEVATSIGELA